MKHWIHWNVVTSDFFAEYELIQTENIEATKERIKDMISGKEVKQDQFYTIIGSVDNMTTEEARNQADEIIYISDFEEE